MPLSRPEQYRHDPQAHWPAAMHALASLRSGEADVWRLVAAVERGEIDPNATLEGTSVTPLLLALRGWSRSLTQARQGVAGLLPEEGLAQLGASGWNGQGECQPFEPLAQALLTAGAEPFPDGQVINVLGALRENAVAFAVGLLSDPRCPPLDRADPTSSVLRWALAHQQRAAVRAALARGADPNATDPDGVPAWFAAVSAETLGWVLDAGADAVRTDGQGRSALEVWALPERALAPTAVKAMSSRLEMSGAALSPEIAIAAAFRATETFRVGPLRVCLDRTPCALRARMPVPGMQDQSESLVEKALRETLAYHRVGAKEHAASAIGMFKLLFEHPDTPADEKEALAIALTAYRLGLPPESRSAAARFTPALRQAVEAQLGQPRRLDGGWAVLARAVERIAASAGSPCGKYAHAQNAPQSAARQYRASEVACDLARALELRPEANRPWGFAQRGGWEQTLAGLAPGFRAPWKDRMEYKETKVLDRLAFLVERRFREQEEASWAYGPALPAARGPREALGTWVACGWGDGVKRNDRLLQFARAGLRTHVLGTPWAEALGQHLSRLGRPPESALRDTSLAVREEWLESLLSVSESNPRRPRM